MSNIVIKAENLSKLYRLGEVGTGTVTHDLNRWWARMCGKEDPFAKIGETNDRTQKGESDYVWSLKDIAFEINQGDAVGIIGRNGAGKSTLLKLLSKVTTPTTGRIKVKGRIASLLEVGTGFHPELTGRENIYLNGAILGMRKQEIKQKFDEIVSFSGVERYIDTPVKRYSSGMYVRLAFAVAAHLESEILIVDEVLAVGDVEFQKKCLGKMGDVSINEGRTVLFVSHDLNAIKNFCVKSLLIEKGKILSNDRTPFIINQYLDLLYSTKESGSFDLEQLPRKNVQGKIKINKLEISYNEKLTTIIPCFQPFTLKLHVNCNEDISYPRISVVLKDFYNKKIVGWRLDESNLSFLAKGLHIISLNISSLNLLPNKLKLSIGIQSNTILQDFVEDCASLEFYMDGESDIIQKHQDTLIISNAEWLII
jgi:lipopolysaccharide transport system ATP-binding protein